MSRAGAIERTCTPSALKRPKGSLLADRRGAVAFEALIVFSFMLFSLLFPAADLAVASFQFISALEALRGFGQYVQYYQPQPDVTNITTWVSGLRTTVAGYTIGNIKVLCGDTGAGVACTAANMTTSPTKYYSYTTTVTLTPLVLKKVLCTSKNINPCAFTLPYTERFQ
ncbi:hypothetical protein [uncultured Rhodoblastus sp.]|uniref:hypothetical protein n=1 Tax=uncultured Rhodoblastus sp. TaxID=543037 RepID=UPI0025EAF651|nr:hypothetical protein [uncultured Rhodoblastus sp.]